MDIQLTKATIEELVKEEVSRLAARSYSEDGASLYDGIKIVSRDSSVLSRMIDESAYSLVVQCERFIDFSSGTTSLVFDFVESDRRTCGKETMLTALIKEIIVKMTVSRFLLSKGVQNEAQVYDQAAANNIALLLKTLYTKRRP